MPGSRAVGARQITSSGFVSVEMNGLTDLVRALGEFPTAVKRELRVAVTEAAHLVGEQAKQNASFSTWIPGAIVESTSFAVSGAGAQVRVNSSRAPSPDHAPLPRLMEFGSPTFRHPVFGNTNAWVAQDAHPFLFPAVREKGAEARQLIAEAVNVAARSVGLA